MKIICSLLLYNTREERVNLICKEYMDTKSDHQEEYTIKAFIFNHWYYFKTATVDIMDVGVDYHFPYPVDLSLSHIWGGTEVAPHRPRDATLQIPINMGGSYRCSRRAVVFLWYQPFQKSIQKNLLFSILLLFYWANKLRTNENLNRKEIGLDK